MHDTALLAGKLFAENYTSVGNLTILDIGGQDFNGSLREFFSKNNNYISVDIESGNGVDVVVPPGQNLPFEDGSVDIVVSSSCFEHDPCFWLTFREMCRVVKKGGYIYVNAPANGVYHRYPGDNYRFYPDAGQALAYWSGKEYEGKIYPVAVEEVFLVYPIADIWIDFVCIWKRVDETKKVTKIVDDSIKQRIGPVRQALKDKNCRTESYTYETHI